MSYLAFWFWNQGNYREKNEDSFSLQRVRLNGLLGRRQEAALVAVCDGIGGLPQGETASGFVVEQLTKWFYRKGLGLMGGLFWTKRTARAAVEALWRIQGQMERCEKAEGICCGTTCTVALVRGKRFLVLHVGDSRAYRVGRKEWRLTQDHVKGGALCRCVGAFSFWHPDLCRGRLGKGDGLLLCTDGFCRLAPQGFFKGALFGENEGEQTPYKRLKGVAGFLRAQGEKDNQTAVLLSYRGRG